MKVPLLVLGIAMLMIALSMSATAQEVPPPPPTPRSAPCLGFRLPNPAKSSLQQEWFGDVFVDCWDHTFQLTSTSDIRSWAIDVRRKRLVLLRSSIDAKKDDLEIVAMEFRISLLLVSGKISSNTKSATSSPSMRKSHVR